MVSQLSPLKILVLGDAAVGKTSFLRFLCEAPLENFVLPCNIANQGASVSTVLGSYRPSTSGYSISEQRYAPINLAADSRSSESQYIARSNCGFDRAIIGYNSTSDAPIRLEETDQGELCDNRAHLHPDNFSAPSAARMSVNYSSKRFKTKDITDFLGSNCQNKNPRVSMRPYKWTCGCSIFAVVWQFNESPTSDIAVPPVVTVPVEFWDVGGTSSYSTVRSLFFESFDGILLLYDASNLTSFFNLSKWLYEVCIRFCSPSRMLYSSSGILSSASHQSDTFYNLERGNVVSVGPECSQRRYEAACDILSGKCPIICVVTKLDKVEQIFRPRAVFHESFSFLERIFGSEERLITSQWEKFFDASNRKSLKLKICQVLNSCPVMLSCVKKYMVDLNMLSAFLQHAWMFHNFEKMK
ncbi:putative Rab-like protein 3 [Cardiosporidium cionae]|uniref:Rab-like protein 3 n=1 Tax=Cardiosporidium cionae TaxID=476202 RepID=A0ABQ7JAR1_9APIC|nr:putative Rab-like protein 3 [Cardiosporidium cionae]|eukprot:KAF8821064.1 putative Rab-like protein 3 [Cardiosporidium cionae]